MGNRCTTPVIDETRLNTIEEISEQTLYNITRKPEYIDMLVDANMSGDLTELLTFVRLKSCCSKCKINRANACIDQCDGCATDAYWNSLSASEKNDIIEMKILPQLGFIPMVESQQHKLDNFDKENPGLEHLVGLEK